MLFQVLQIGTILFIFKKSKQRLILAQKNFLKKTHTIAIKLIYISIFCCIAYISIFLLYFAFTDFKLRIDLPSELNYEALAWENIKPTKTIVDEYIKNFFLNFYSLIKFIINELIV